MGSTPRRYARGLVEANMSLFASNIDHAVQLREAAADRVALGNADGLTKTWGAELLLRYRWQAFTLTGSYVHIDATEPDTEDTGRRVPLTPRCNLL
jgi:iron complex outermembrane receptor protein